MRPLVAILVLAGLVLSTPALAVNVGEPAPGFTLFDTQGVQRSLSDYQGQVVVLFFVGYG